MDSKEEFNSLRIFVIECERTSRRRLSRR